VVKYLSKYDIAFKGLKESVHQFEYELDDRFFDNFENSEVEKGSLKAVVLLTKQTTLMILDFTIEGSVELQCDRCLDLYMQQISSKGKLYIKFGHEEEELSDEIIVISLDEHLINISHYLYEQVILGLPVKHVHPKKSKGDNGCNPEMIKKLKEYLVESVEDKAEEGIDERWSELKKLVNNK
jgi:uncharacterized protein